MNITRKSFFLVTNSTLDQENRYREEGRLSALRALPLKSASNERDNEQNEEYYK